MRLMTKEELFDFRVHDMEMTQEELADKLGVSVALISRMESGDRIISKRTMAQIESIKNERKRPGPKRAS